MRWCHDGRRAQQTGRWRGSSARDGMDRETSLLERPANEKPDCHVACADARGGLLLGRQPRGAGALMPTLDGPSAVALVTTLRSISSSIRDNHAKRLQAQLGAPGGGVRSLDKSGSEIQAEAMQGALQPATS